jgi:PTS system beta-glucosides-specific IIC component
MSTVERGGQFQVVVGHEVAGVERLVRTIVLEATGGQELAEAPPPMSILDRVFDLLAGTFQPLLWAMVGAGLVRTMLSLAVRFGWVEQGSGTWAVWAAAGNGFFVLLPVFVGITASRKLGANPYVGGAIGAALVSGSLLELGAPGTRSTFLGIPMSVVDYSSSVFPAILAAMGLAALEGWLRRVLPKDLHLVLVPALCLALLVPLTVLLIGPLGTVAGEWLADAVTTMNTMSPVVTGALYAALFMFLVMLGLHWATVPVTLALLAEEGAEPLGAYMGAYNFAAFGIALGVAVRTRDPALRQLGVSGVVTGLLAGISEPTVYGILLRFRRALLIMLVAAATGGALLGLGRVQATSVAFSNLFTIPAFTPVGGYLLGIGVAFGMAAVGVIALGYGADESQGVAVSAAPPRDGHDEQPGAATAPPLADGSVAPPPAETVASRHASTAAGLPNDDAALAPGDQPTSAPPQVLRTPLPGEVVALGSLPDPVFARGLLGPGVAILPASGLVRAPAAGFIRSVARAQHALGLETDAGVELLIHLGLDTVHLAGRHFDVLVTPGQRVEPGDPIAHVELDELTGQGYDPTTPIVITNVAGNGEVELLAPVGSRVRIGDPLLTVRFR